MRKEGPNLSIDEILNHNKRYVQQKTMRPTKHLARKRVVDPERLMEHENLGDIQGLVRRLGAFEDVHVNVREVVNAIRNSHYLPKIPVHGLVIDINTGKLELVDRAKITSTQYDLQT